MNYHQFILSQLRKEREMQLELDLEPKHPEIRCRYCKEEVPQPFFVVKHFGYITHEFAFCNEEHANEYYLDKLRESGFE